MGRSVFVKADLAGQQHLLLDGCWPRLGHHHTGRLGLRRAQLDQALARFFAFGMAAVRIFAAGLGFLIVVLAIAMLVCLLVRIGLGTCFGARLGSGLAMVLTIFVGWRIGMA